MVSKVAARGLSAVSGMAGGLLASVIFKQTWKLIAGKDDAPQAQSREYGWTEVLVASAIQGAIYGVVKAAIDRGGARTYEKATGHWPD